MKKMICLLLLVCLVLPAPGCAAQKEEITDPVVFYYPRTEVDYDAPDGVFAREIRSRAGADAFRLLEALLRGPESEALANPFPKGTLLTELRQEGGTVYITLSNEFAALKGIKLSVACVCITLTAAELLGVDAAAIRTPNGEVNTTIFKDRLMLIDQGGAPTE